MTHPYTKIIEGLAELDPAGARRAPLELHGKYVLAAVTDNNTGFQQDLHTLRELGPKGAEIADRLARVFKVPADGYGDAAPIDMILHCPACGLQHIDAPEESDPTTWAAEKYGNWTNPPHRSHLCHGCGHIWRPADVPTNGVAAVKTKGEADSTHATRLPMQPIETDTHGVVRFKGNRIVGNLLERYSNMNEIARDAAQGQYTAEEQMQFAQLIGYSVSGYCTLSYVSDESAALAKSLITVLQSTHTTTEPKP